MRKHHLLLIDNSHVSPNDFSGGQRIVIETFQRLKDDFHITVATSNFGKKIWQKYVDEGINFRKIIHFNRKKSSPLSYLRRAIIAGSKLVASENKFDIVYSASDFWPDALPALFLKFFRPSTTWVAGFYLFVPPPWSEESPYRGRREKITNFLYWLTQRPMYYLVRWQADQVWVTSQPDVDKFPGQDCVVVRGGVDLSPYRKVKAQPQRYEAVFIGRFHPQKGLLELVDIWRQVVDQQPEARLAIIGCGPLEQKLRKKIRQLGLGDNIKLLGFLDGIEKITVFKQSQVVVHPATYDSGGMAAMEAMAAGLPGVSFDLEALKTYYPKGMIKTPCFNTKLFAANILRLLKDKDRYQELQQKALELAREWSWDKRSRFLKKEIERVA